jgi:NADPH2:quinone reductase
VKAILVRQFGEPDVMRLEEVPDPAPGPGEILLRVRAAGVNPVETYIRKGAYARKPELPYTPGADAAGSVEAVGDGVGWPAPGTRVYVAGTIGSSLGTYAELTLCRATQAYPLPDRVSFEQGAAVAVPYGTAWRALMQRGAARPGETVLVHGASGGVGVAAVQIARAAGLRVLGTAGSERGAALVRTEGADEVFDHRASGYTDRILEATGGRGVDLIVEMLANVNLARDLTLLARNGRVIVVGNRGTIEIDPRQAMSRDADIRGLILFNTPPEEMASLHAGIGAGLRDGTLRPVVGQRFPLADAPRAHEAVLAPGAYGKIVLIP